LWPDLNFSQTYLKFPDQWCPAIRWIGYPRIVTRALRSGSQTVDPQTSAHNREVASPRPITFLHHSPQRRHIMAAGALSSRTSALGPLVAAEDQRSKSEQRYRPGFRQTFSCWRRSSAVPLGCYIEVGVGRGCELFGRLPWNFGRFPPLVFRCASGHYVSPSWIASASEPVPPPRSMI
jgi:hypothetical protein